MQSTVVRLWIQVICIAWCFAGLTSAAQTNDRYPMLHIYLITDEMPAADGTESPNTLRLRRRMQEFPMLRYQIHYASWPRILTEVAQRSDALVYKLLRSPGREEQYSWVLFDDVIPLHLFCLKDEPRCNHTLAKLKYTQGIKIACPKQSAHCELLRQYGFSAAQVLEISLSQQDSVERLLLAKRVPFIAVAEFDLNRRLALMGVPREQVIKGPQVAVLKDYLAGGLKLDPAIQRVFFTAKQVAQ